MQFSTVFSNYYSDQLQEDIQREERIRAGEITRSQANKDDEEWQDVSERKLVCRRVRSQGSNGYAVAEI